MSDNEQIKTTAQQRAYEESLTCPECSTSSPRVEWVSVDAFRVGRSYVPGFANCTNPDCGYRWPGRKS
ncbi:hypothetical protein CLV72_11228 [Allonocardiopsis opalescens]|uniref:Uncharacterized protein n=1 Tax=Allonocardiopsis opalescens TaxID=1144618 RepID=A0A2T0PSU0_9ACTN|nr:hypothetical protein CLV72_11228 [Allonocardiopsis opalescens]